jgi:hypothetical protein
MLSSRGRRVLSVLHQSLCRGIRIHRWAFRCGGNKNPPPIRWNGSVSLFQQNSAIDIAVHFDSIYHLSGLVDNLQGCLTAAAASLEYFINN